MKTVTFILFFTLIISQLDLSAQNQDSSTLIKRPFQLTFVTPLGTNGTEAGKCVNDFSINLFAGYNGGVSGVEFGGFSNIIRHDMDGLQFAGFSNVVNGNTTGCQFSGFSNFNRKAIKGGQFAGFSNIVTDSATIVQAAGFLNFVKGKTKGVQAAGFANISTGDAFGVQAAGFTNIVSGNTKGTQAAGFANISTGDTKAVQLAGFTNITPGTMEGLQVSGFANVAKKLKGVQLAPFNFCDTVENGIPIGVFSFVRKGYHAIDISADETLYLNASLHLGVRSFYNIISVGVRPNGNGFYWGYGYGWGSYIRFTKRIDFNIELNATHFNTDEWWTNSLNLVNKLKLNAVFNLSDHVSMYGGINYNVLVTDRKDSEGFYTDSGIAPWETYSKIHHNVLVKMYPGLNAGIRFLW